MRILAFGALVLLGVLAGQVAGDGTATAGEAGPTYLLAMEGMT